MNMETIKITMSDLMFLNFQIGLWQITLQNDKK
jgi:hypothetical protein